MIALAWYLLKVIVCSGILCGYYYLALRNKIFHRWNRFYLLASAVLALGVPLMKINIFQNASEDKGTVIRMLQTINSSDETIIEYSSHSGLQFNSANFISVAYILITLIFLSIFFLALYKIFSLKKKYAITKMKGISFISTDARGTPFSFFNSIFWNNAIDLHSRQGQQIFNHEIAHIKEKHSYDKIFMNVLLIFFWINPFFWLMRKELSMIHEFIADKEALEDSDISAFAEMVLQTVYPGQKFSLANNFFHSPLKRRLIMFTKNKNPKVSYLSRLLVLPLAIIVFFAFTIKMKTIQPATNYSGKQLTVIIDAGHGGEDNGAVSQNGLFEKDINLSIAKEIAALNKNNNIKILLSRDNDVNIPVKSRVEFSNSKHADLFISIHVNTAGKNALDEKGFSVLIDKNNLEKNKLLASALLEELKKTYVTENVIGVRQNNIYVIDNSICPAALIECGYLTNPADVDFISKSENQKKIARNILDAIEKFGDQNLTDNNISISEFTDTTPANKISSPEPLFVVDGKIVSKGEATAIDHKNIDSINILKGESAIKKYGEKGKNGVVEIAKKKLLIKETPNAKNTTGAITSPVYFYDGKEISKDEMKEIPPNHIESINVLKGGDAIKKYGEKGKNGVIEIYKQKNELTVKSALGISTINPTPLYIVDGKEISKDEMTKIPAPSIESINVLKSKSATAIYGEKAKNGVVLIETKTGNLNTSATVNTNSNNSINIHLSNEKNNISGDTIPDKLFTKVENEASFPGGNNAWLKYITGIIQKNGSELMANKNNSGTCIVKFIVNTNGKVSNAEATTMKGTELANIAVNAVKDGPNWIPAKQNDHVVASYRLQPVSFLLSNQSPQKKTEPQ
jgi:TonB-dependent SusC/RagA subfamily outer membrane receptor